MGLNFLNEMSAEIQIQRQILISPRKACPGSVTGSSWSSHNPIATMPPHPSCDGVTIWNCTPSRPHRSWIATAAWRIPLLLPSPEKGWTWDISTVLPRAARPAPGRKRRCVPAQPSTRRCFACLSQRPRRRPPFGESPHVCPSSCHPPQSRGQSWLFRWRFPVQATEGSRAPAEDRESDTTLGMGRLRMNRHRVGERHRGQGLKTNVACGFFNLFGHCFLQTMRDFAGGSGRRGRRTIRHHL
jgi:hypothetical protein